MIPDEERKSEYASLIDSWEPLAHAVIGFMDGVSVPSESSWETLEENAMYIGYYSDTMVNNVITYEADGNVFVQ